MTKRVDVVRTLKVAFRALKHHQRRHLRLHLKAGTPIFCGRGAEHRYFNDEGHGCPSVLARFVGKDMLGKLKNCYTKSKSGKYYYFNTTAAKSIVAIYDLSEIVEVMQAATEMKYLNALAMATEDEVRQAIATM